jgi:outer membrane protein assembly factor BamD
LKRTIQRDIALALSCLVLLGMAFVTPGCASKSKTTQVAGLSGEQLYQRGLDLLEQGKYLSSVEALREIDWRFAGANRNELEPLVKLALADATFYQDTIIALIDARQMYLDFVTLYGDHRLAPYAQFQSGMCSLKQVRSPSKDQTQTFSAFRDLRQVLRRYPNSLYARAAQDMIRQAEGTLAEHEFLIGRFYMKRKFYVAAQERFRNIVDQYPSYAQKEKVYFYLGQTLLLNDNEVEARIYLGKLISDFPDGNYVQQAHKALNGVNASLGSP